MGHGDCLGFLWSWIFIAIFFRLLQSMLPTNSTVVEMTSNPHNAGCISTLMRCLLLCLWKFRVLGARADNWATCKGSDSFQNYKSSPGIDAYLFSVEKRCREVFWGCSSFHKTTKSIYNQMTKAFTNFIMYMHWTSKVTDSGFGSSCSTRFDWRWRASNFAVALHVPVQCIWTETKKFRRVRNRMHTVETH